MLGRNALLAALVEELVLDTQLSSQDPAETVTTSMHASASSGVEGDVDVVGTGRIPHGAGDAPRERGTGEQTTRPRCLQPIQSGAASEGRCQCPWASPSPCGSPSSAHCAAATHALYVCLGHDRRRRWRQRRSCWVRWVCRCKRHR
ncbi:hypothetical protein B0H11DRAFT_2270094 [Mycena galericulata]|nr:hypothetical protein B0H11DRAFT_2270094 [Mycena galericulata]